MSVISFLKPIRYSSYSLGIIALTVLFFRFYFPHNNPISFDVFGYYLYLPFGFIYNNLGLSDFSQLQQLFDEYNPSVSLYQVNPGLHGFWIMKYSMGMAILYAPFFFLSHFFALLTDFPSDGFSLPYQWGMIIGSTLYTVLGVFFLRRILLKFLTDKVAAITMLVLFFGTNYFDQSLFNAELSHNHLFTLYTLVLWFTIRWHEAHKRKYITLLAIFIGILVLARPTEIIALLIPLLWGVFDKESLKARINLLWQFKPQMLLFLIILILIGSIQMLYWKIYSGQLLFISYTNAGEGLDFTAPHTLQTLFSFRKGWLVYTPLMVFAIWGFYFVFKNKRNIFFPLFVFFVLNLYLVSSWSCWWYANCFSQRALVQSYAIMAIPLGFFIQGVSNSTKLYKGIFAVVTIILLVLNLFQTWQMKNNILSGDRMTFSYYQRIFGKTDATAEDKKLLLVDRWLEGEEILKDESGYKSRKLVSESFKNPSGKHKMRYEKEPVRSIPFSFHVDSSILYFNLYEASFKTITNHDHAWLRLEYYVYPLSEIDLGDFMSVITFKHKGKVYKYRGMNIFPLIKDKTLQVKKWNKISFDYLTPEVRSKEDVLHIYFWNKGRGQVIIDDVSLTAFEPTED